MAPSDFPAVEDAVLQRKHAADRFAWRACFSEWGVAWEDDVHAEMVELFTRARDVTPSYVIHFALGKVTADEPATRTGLQDWFSRMLSAIKQGIDEAVAEPLCRVLHTHVLAVITAAYTRYGFSLPDSVHNRPAALSQGRGKGDEANVLRSVQMPSGLESSPTVLRRGKRKASVAELGSADAERVKALKTSAKSVAKSDFEMDGAVSAADGSASDANGGHDRTMVRMMTAVGIMLKYYNPETMKGTSLHDVFLRMHPRVLKGMSKASTGLMVSSWRWARRGSKGREERPYDRLHALALTKPGVSSVADALQYVRDLHAVMTRDRFWRYKHVTRTAGSVSIPWQEWLAEAKAWVPTLEADRAGKPRPPPPAHEHEAELLAIAADEEEAAILATASVLPKPSS